jgi:AAA family ATP:ADP antiporter
MLIVAQFWGFANDLYTESQGKRLFPVVGAGVSIGGVLGALAAGKLFKPLGPYAMMLLAGAMLAVSVLISRIVHWREASGGAAQKRVEAKQPIGGAGGFQLVFRERYLLLIAGFVLLLNLINTTGEFVLSSLVQREAARVAGPDTAAQRVFIGEFTASIYSWVNLLSMAFQLFLVSRIFLFIGVRGALFVLPLIAMGGYALILTAPILALVRYVKILENSTDYSLTNTARHALFLPTSREAKYKAKAAIDSFFVRTGDMLQAAIVFAGTALALPLAGFAAVNLVLTFVWVGVVVLIYREHKRRTGAAGAAAA